LIGRPPGFSSSEAPAVSLPSIRKAARLPSAE
jgi:hypothetical protein